MRTFIVRASALALVACSSPSATPPPKVDPAKGSATTTSAATLTPGTELPEVALSGYIAADKVEPTVAATLTGITVDGKLIASLQDGIVRADELQDGALGFVITNLRVVADRLAQTKRITLAFDKRIPYRTLLSTIYTLKQAGHKEFGVLARAGAHVVMAPITLPDKRDPKKAELSSRNAGTDLASELERAKNGNSTESILRKIQSAYLAGIKACYKQELKRDPAVKGKLELKLTVDTTGKVTQGRASGISPALDACVTGLMENWRFEAAKDPKGQAFTIVLVLQPDHEPAPEGSISKGPPLQLVVSISKTDLLLWSISQQEGTLGQPRFAGKLAEKSALDDLNRTLAEIVAKRFTGDRPTEDRAIILMAEAATSMQMIADVIGAVRATPDAKELFPDIQLATAFE